MSRIIKYLIILILGSFPVLADDIKGDLLNKVSNQISEYVESAIPGEGVTEFNLELKEESEPSFSILALRNLDKQSDSNLFTQFSFHSEDVAGDERYMMNLGLGKRFLNSDKSIMYGANIFLDRDLAYRSALFSRGSIGFEAKGEILEFSYNQYLSLSGAEEFMGVNQQALSGNEFNLNSQIPYMPWAVISWQGYKHYADLSSQSVEGDVYSMELALTPRAQLDLKHDISNSDEGNAYSALLTFIHPPRQNKPTLLDGAKSNDMFVKANMEDSLLHKVRRNNNIAVEIQGAVTFTKK